MSQPWKTLLPIGYLAMTNPPEALGVYLIHQCDKWRMSEQDLQAYRTPRYPFQDIMVEVKGLVSHLLRCVELDTVVMGRCHGLVLEELDRADYHVEYIPSVGNPTQAMFYVMFKDKIMMSEVIPLPANRMQH